MYDCLLEALICGDTPVSCHNYPEAYKEMCQFDSEIGKTKLEEQFEVRAVCRMSPRDSSIGVNCWGGGGGGFQNFKKYY